MKIRVSFGSGNIFFAEFYQDVVVRNKTEAEQLSSGFPSNLHQKALENNPSDAFLSHYAETRSHSHPDVKVCGGSQKKDEKVFSYKEWRDEKERALVGYFRDTMHTADGKEWFIDQDFPPEIDSLVGASKAKRIKKQAIDT